MNRYQRAVLFGGLLCIALPTFCFLMACWHARTLDYGEKWGATGFISVFALAFAGLPVFGITGSA